MNTGSHAAVGWGSSTEDEALVGSQMWLTRHGTSGCSIVNPTSVPYQEFFRMSYSLPFLNI